MKTENRSYIPDRLVWSETNRENRERFYFPEVSQISAMVAIIPGIWKLNFVLSGTSATVLARYQSSKLIGSIPSLPNTTILRYLGNKLNQREHDYFAFCIQN